MNSPYFIQPQLVDSSYCQSLYLTVKKASQRWEKEKKTHEIQNKAFLKNIKTYQTWPTDADPIPLPPVLNTKLKTDLQQKTALLFKDCVKK